MTSITADTIAAIATPPGKGGVGVIRISGKNSKIISKAITKKNLKPRNATLSNFYSSDNSVIDQGIAIYFKRPNSFTGEDVVELQGHGGPVILDRLLNEILKSGARMARPGEFSERAFLNDKIDLIQAEAIADLINSGTEQAAKAAINSLQGIFSKKIHELLEKLIHLRMYVEAALDFPEEEIDFLSDKQVKLMLTNLKEAFQKIFTEAKQGSILQEGINIVIIGKPNAGKSSLLNQLAGQDRAIVTDIAGTTRDILKEYIQIDGIPLHVIDTAGLRHDAEMVEKIGIERAYQEIEKADFILCLFDAKEFELQKLKSILQDWKVYAKKIILVKNKIDLTKEDYGFQKTNNYEFINISAKTGKGIEELKKILIKKIGFDAHLEGNFSARRRHVDALNRAYDYVIEGEKQLCDNKAGELFAEDLSQAQKSLAEITGEYSADDLLGDIFSSFCIGK